MNRLFIPPGRSSFFLLQPHLRSALGIVGACAYDLLSAFAFFDMFEKYCEWTYTGHEKGRPEVDVTSEWHITGDGYERFREAGNMVDWEILIITARPNPLPRPQCPICLDDMFFEEEKPSLACGIRFHGHCLETWKIRVT